jgi:L-lactate dehydrogenase complex protein LldG
VSGSARADILGRIRAVPAPEIPRRYRTAGAAEGAVERFCERVAEYQATVRRVERDALAPAVKEVCEQRGARRIGVPPGLRDAIAGLDTVVDDPPLETRELDALDAVVTGCALAIADTGTIVLDGGERSGRRALTLVPDHHICLVEADAIVPSVPDAIAALAVAAAEGRPLTLVSGPSATSDIELERVEGVHGPRVLDVLVVVG